MKKKYAYFCVAALSALVLAGCSNVLTYIRHDESNGNTQCSADKALKRDSTCNVSQSAAAK